MTYEEKRAAIKLKRKNRRMIILLVISLLFIVAMSWKIACNLNARFEKAAPQANYSEQHIANLKEQFDVSHGQEYAVTLALEYLNIQAFSRKGLIEQLQYNDCTPEDAAWAANYCGANWEDQAVLKACSYLDNMSFSYKGLVEQLEYEGFTHDEAKHGVGMCGADWNEQAAAKAKQYLSLMPYSRDELIDQLVYEGFTKDQARYGAREALK